MTPKAQRIAIAEACGWICNNPLHKTVENLSFSNGEDECGWKDLPDYLNDLNAMHEAEKALNAEQQIVYQTTLVELVASARHWKHVTFDLLHATAAQRAEAFLRTIGKWVSS